MDPPVHTFPHLSDYAAVLRVALGERDGPTRFHSDRVVVVALEVGRLCGLGEEDIDLLQLAASLHDLGKIGIPDHILFKPGRLDDQEWDQMRTHPLIGEKILRSLPLSGAERVAAVVRNHHEHYDGTGYPDGLAGESIPILSRIIGIADSYDALASSRIYLGYRNHAQVMSILHGEVGHKHDPYVFARFEELLGDAPHPGD